MPANSTAADTAPCVILAGGGARRMGGTDKALMQLGGHSLLRHVLNRLDPHTGPVALSANGDPARFADFGLPVLPDAVADAGPLGGILAGLDWAAEQGAATVISLPVDTPFFPRNLCSGLVDTALQSGAAVVLAQGRDAAGASRLHPVFASWDVRLRTPLRQALDAGQRRLDAWATTQAAVICTFPYSGADPFLNINTLDDLDQAEARLSAQ